EGFENGCSSQECGTCGFALLCRRLANGGQGRRGLRHSHTGPTVAIGGRRGGIISVATSRETMAALVYKGDRRGGSITLAIGNITLAALVCNGRLANGGQRVRGFHQLIGPTVAIEGRRGGNR